MKREATREMFPSLAVEGGMEDDGMGESQVSQSQSQSRPIWTSEQPRRTNERRFNEPRATQPSAYIGNQLLSPAIAFEERINKRRSQDMGKKRKKSKGKKGTTKKDLEKVYGNVDLSLL
jgi:hypothetical protein